MGAGAGEPRAPQGWVTWMATGLTSQQLIHAAQISPV